VFTEVNAMSVVDEALHLRRLRATQDRLRHARQARDHAIGQAIKAKITYRKVGQAVGLHVSHVHKIAKSDPTDPMET
jgi:hypothetical protein